jgi:hypothetical protein
MPRYEYRVVPAPVRGEKARGLKTTGDRFAQALTTLLNEMARDGWDYLKAEVLPCEERKGLTGRTFIDQHVLVFRRPAPESIMAAGFAPETEGPLRLGPRLDPGEPPRLRPSEPGAAPRLGPARGED